MPIKKYSSGMYVRLAFAVAAHIDAEILLVDEVLAVGDAAFRKKSLSKMQDVSESGKTIIFVSHNMAAIENLCTRCVVLSNGKIEMQGNPREAIRYYHNKIFDRNPEKELLKNAQTRNGDGRARFQNVEIFQQENKKNQQIYIGGELTIRVDVKSNSRVNVPQIIFIIKDKLGQTISWLNTRESVKSIPPFDKDSSFICKVPKLTLLPGKYNLSLWLSEQGRTIDYVDFAQSFDVLESDVFNTGYPPNAKYGGVFFTEQQWRFEKRD